MGGTKNELCDIGTKLLFVQCFVTTDMLFLFCKPIIFCGNCCILRDLAFGSVKTRFKAILKQISISAQIVFLWTFAPGGRLRYEAYNVEVSKYPRIKITKVRIGHKLPQICQNVTRTTLSTYPVFSFLSLEPHISETLFAVSGYRLGYAYFSFSGSEGG